MPGAEADQEVGIAVERRSLPTPRRGRGRASPTPAATARSRSPPRSFSNKRLVAPLNPTKRSGVAVAVEVRGGVDERPGSNRVRVGLEPGGLHGRTRALLRTCRKQQEDAQTESYRRQSGSRLGLEPLGGGPGRGLDRRHKRAIELGDDRRHVVDELLPVRGVADPVLHACQAPASTPVAAAVR